MALTQKEIVLAMIDGATLVCMNMRRQSYSLHYPNGSFDNVGLATGYKVSCMQEIVMLERCLTSVTYVHKANS